MMDKTIAQAAQTAKKPNKDECLAIIRDLATRHEDAQTQADYARLFLYFTPSAPKKPKTVWDWVASAAAPRARGKSRDYSHNKELHLIQVTSETIAATDGHRLHLAPSLGGIPPGYYCPRTGDYLHSLTDKDVDYPDLKQYLAMFKNPMHAVAKTVLIQVETNLNYRLYKEDDTPGPLVSAALYDAAFALPKADPDKAKVEFLPNDPIMITFERGELAMVMPLNEK